MKKLFFNPFEKHSEKKLLITGIISNLIGILLNFVFNIKTIGILKFDFLDKISIFQVASQSLIIISISSLLLFVTGKIINSKTRFIDVFNAVLIAKIPFFIIPFFNINGTLYHETQKLETILATGKILEITISTIPVIIIVGLLSILLSVWAIILLYKGFKIATNAKGTKPIFCFFIGFVVIEIISRLIILSIH